MMPELTEAKPTHLSVFAFENESGAPIVRMPFFAEVGMAASAGVPVGQLDRRLDDAIGVAVREGDATCNDDDQCRQRLRDAVRDVVSRLLDPDARNELATDANAGKMLMGIIRRAQESSGQATLRQLTPESLTESLENAVRSYAREHGLPTVSTNEQRMIWTYPLGTLATDHVGYLSFDLTRLPASVQDALGQALLARSSDPNAVLPVALWLYPAAVGVARIDAFEQGRFSLDAIVVKLGLARSGLWTTLEGAGLPAMQSPGLADWRLSGGSFATNPSALLGEEGCENLLPANTALQEFHLYQVVRITDLELVPQQLQDQVRVGVIHEFRLAWYPLGHSLGQILYSLPLAPGESVNLAVIDWSRRDEAQRTEQTKLDEHLAHDEHRDRSITETVQAGLGEYQHGSSFLAGVATAVGAAYGGAALGAAAGLAGSLGGSTSSSDGSRHLAADTIQKVSDNISQASSALRELQSTVVVQSSQEEKEAIETRTIANYNHSHTLTALYYEVLRHFRVVTEFVRRRPAVLARVRTDWFSAPDAEENIRENRAALEAALIDPSLAEGFNALERIHHRAGATAATPQTAAFDPGDRAFIYFTFHIKTGGLIVGQANDQRVDVSARLIGAMAGIPAMGNWIQLLEVNGGKDELSSRGSFKEPDKVTTFTACLPDMMRTVKWRDIAAVEIHFHPELVHVAFEHITVVARDLAGHDETLVDQDYADGHLFIFEDKDVLLPAARPSPPAAPPVPSAEEIDDQAKRTELLDHLRYHNAHYSRALLLNVETAERARQLNLVAFPDGSTLLDKVENRPVEVLGEFVAYPCTNTAWTDAIQAKLDHAQAPAPTAAEQLMTLPTRGVFAEAKLGHCNASEEIDNTRFWDWQQSPIPHMAPEIAPVEAVTPQPAQTNLSPTAFPTSLLNIVNAPAAPDPTGLAGALGVLGTPNIFRDMSGRQEVAGLLTTLSDNAVKIAELANTARGGKSPTVGNGASTTTGGNGTSIPSGVAGTPKLSQSPAGDSSAAEKAQIDNEKARLEVAKAELTPKEQSEVRAIATKNLTSTPPTTTLKTFVFKAKDYRGMDLEFALGVRVLDVKDIDATGSKKVMDGSFTRAASAQIQFKEADPIVDVQIDRDPVEVDFGVMKYTVPKIRLTTEPVAQIKSTQSLVQVTVRQSARQVDIEQENIDKAATELTDKFGAELGLDKVVALKLLAEQSKQTTVERSGKQIIKYSLPVPGGAFTLTVG